MKSKLSVFNESAEGRKTLALFRRFWGIKQPPRIVNVRTPGKGRMFLVGCGVSPKVYLADGQRGKHKRKWVLHRRGQLCCNSRGTRLYILKPNSIPGKPVKFLGYAPQTDYIPSAAIEKAGSFKANTHWQHEHHERGGQWPKVYEDRNGNIIYGPGSYRVGKWIEK